MRVTRKAILALLDNFFSVCIVSPETVTKFVEPLLPSIFQGYCNCNVLTKEPLVLKVMATMTKKMKKLLSNYYKDFIEKGIQPTLPLITNNTVDCPTHRTYFYSLLQMLIQYCFKESFVQLPEYQKLLIDCIVWGIKHVERNISEESLETLNTLLENVKSSQIGPSFWQSYYMTLLSEVLYVLTDRCHKNSFHQQVVVLKNLFTIAITNRIINPLFDPSQFPPGITNVQYITLFLTDLLGNAFSHVSKDIIGNFIQLLFGKYASSDDEFRVIVRDFLIQMTEFSNSGSDNKDLYIAEKEQYQRQCKEQELAIQNSVPGLKPQYDTPLTIKKDFDEI